MNFQYAAELALGEASNLSGREQFFAWFNRGTNLVYLQDYAGAAQAYDTAFTLYAGLPQNERPWRLLWYQDGPYAAYYHTGRYQDVINLAHTTLVNVDKPVLEETYYWRGMAKAALGDRQGAVEDLQRAYTLNPNSTLAGEELRRINALMIQTHLAESLRLNLENRLLLHKKLIRPAKLFCQGGNLKHPYFQLVSLLHPGKYNLSLNNRQFDMERFIQQDQVSILADLQAAFVRGNADGAGGVQAGGDP